MALSVFHDLGQRVEGGAVEALDHQPGDIFADRRGILDALRILAGIGARAHLRARTAGIEDRGAHGRNVAHFCAVAW